MLDDISKVLDDRCDVHHYLNAGGVCNCDSRFQKILDYTVDLITLFCIKPTQVYMLTFVGTLKPWNKVFWNKEEAVKYAERDCSSELRWHGEGKCIKANIGRKEYTIRWE